MNTGTVYMLSRPPHIKLGFTDQIPWTRRLHQIRNASPDEIAVLAARPATYDQEQELHAGAAQWKHKGDWYNDCPELRVYCDKFFYPDAVPESPFFDLPDSEASPAESADLCAGLSAGEPAAIQVRSEFD
jgi:hypothetical protein